MFSQPIKMKGFIHTGPSCGQQGGCNNASPHEPHLYFSIEKIPAEMQLGLWKEEPSGRQKPDFLFTIALQ